MKQIRIKCKYCETEVLVIERLTGEIAVKLNCQSCGAPIKVYKSVGGEMNVQ